MKSAIVLTASLTLGLYAVRAESPEIAVDPNKPTGRLNVNQHMVRQGVSPMLDWEINYPKSVDDLVDIDPIDDSITSKQRSLMEVRVVGAGFQLGSTHTDLALQAKVGNSSWGTLYYGTDSQVIPSEVLTSQIIEAGTRIDFAARAKKLNGSWYSSRDTQGESPTVQALTNGAYVPNYLPAYDQSTVSSFLSEYISSENYITVGPRDVIYLYELYSTDPSSRYFDMQDIVVVVTFKDVPE